jgi:hypothetical protein
MNLTILIRAVPEILFCAGVAVGLAGLWFASWQAGLVGVGMLLIVAGVAAHGARHRADERRRGG